MSRKVEVEIPVTLEEAELAAEGMLRMHSIPHVNTLVSPPPSKKKAEDGGLVYPQQTESESAIPVSDESAMKITQTKKSIAEGKLCQIYNGGGKMILQFAATVLFFKPALATGIKALAAAIEAVCEKGDE